VAPQPYRGAHFATYPPALIEPCILAGTSERGQCPKCGKAWARVVERKTATPGQNPGYLAETGRRNDGDRAGHFIDVQSNTTGWRPQCDCCWEDDDGNKLPYDPIPQTVLDPFNGSGTTGAVAVKYHRSYIGIELNPAYIELTNRRLAEVQPVLLENS
jgi:hypothetical protein